MAQGQISLKRVGVDKTNARIFIITAVASFLVVFFLVGSFSLLGQLKYQNKVIKAKKTAVTELKKNISASAQLEDSYKTFANAQTNFIGGSALGSGSQDGTNAKIALDALPSKYDFPALASSLEKIASDQKVTITQLSGTDDEVAQSVPPTTAPQPVQMPFSIKVTGDYAAIQRVLDAFDHSIRPIQAQTVEMSGDQSSLGLTLTAVTYYQPERTLTNPTEVIK